MKTVKGIGDAKATVIYAAIEFGRRKFKKSVKPIITTPEAAAAQFEAIRRQNREHFAIITLDGARRVINYHLITVGTINASIVHPREVFAPAIEDRAASVIAAHNHPGGTLDVSAQDLEVTRRLRDAGELLGIILDDHIIVTEDGHASINAR